MSGLRGRMIQDMKLAGLVEGTRREYLRAVRQLATYCMLAPDQLNERKVEQYLLYVRERDSWESSRAAVYHSLRRSTT